MKFKAGLIVIAITILIGFAYTIDHTNRKTVFYNYNAARSEMSCTYDNSELIYDNIHVEENMAEGSYTIYAHCPYCYQKFSITYNAAEQIAHKFIEY